MKYAVSIREVVFRENVMIIRWDANIGFGETTVILKDGKVLVDAETLKEPFLLELYSALSTYLLIKGELVG